MSMQVTKVWWDGDKLMAEPISESEVYKPEPVTEWLTCPKCSHKSPYSPIKAKNLAEEAERITKQARSAIAQMRQEPVGRTDQQIVDQTEALAVWLLSWCFNHQPETDTPMRESTHPFAERCWAAACHIQEMMTATDPENSVAELESDPQPSKPWQGLTHEDKKRVLDSDFGGNRADCMDAAELILREKNA